MAIDSKYGKLDIPGLGEDEPIFIIVGHDKACVQAVNDYADLAYPDSFNTIAQGSRSPDPEFIGRIHDRAQEIQAWQDENQNLVKIAD